MSKKTDDKWLCIQRYYDNGRVKTTVVPKTGEVRAYENCSNFDYYVDEFDTKEEAEKWAEKARNA